MENNKNKKSVKFQGDMLNFCDFIQVFIFTKNHHLKFQTSMLKIYMNLVTTGLGDINTKEKINFDLLKSD